MTLETDGANIVVGEFPHPTRSIYRKIRLLLRNRRGEPRGVKVYGVFTFRREMKYHERVYEAGLLIVKQKRKRKKNVYTHTHTLR